MISVAICTYNRSKSLAVTLDTLAGQRGGVRDWELLVLDNACTDRTPEVVSAFAERLPVRRVLEPRQGLSHARNRALREARGELLLFTDDDVRLDPDWLAAFAAANEELRSAEYFGGRVLADWQGEPPRWFRVETAELFDGVLVQYDRGGARRPLAEDEPPPIGASFALRRSLMERNGEFRVDLGVRGLENGRGEETEYLLRARRGGAAGAYVGDALCWHPVDRTRFRLGRLYRHGIASGIAHGRIQAVDQEGSLPRAALFLLRGGVQLLKGRGDRFRRCLLNCGIEVGLRRASRPRARQ